RLWRPCQRSRRLSRREAAGDERIVYFHFYFVIETRTEDVTSACYDPASLRRPDLEEGRSFKNMVHRLSNVFPPLLALLLALSGPVAAQKRPASPAPPATPAPSADTASDETFYDTVEVNVVNVEV